MESVPSWLTKNFRSGEMVGALPRTVSFVPWCNIPKISKLRSDLENKKGTHEIAEKGLYRLIHRSQKDHWLRKDLWA